MKILIACNDLEYFIAHRANLLKPLLDRGHDVSICAGGRGTSIGQLPKNVQFIPVEINQHHLDPRSDLKLIARYARIMEDMEPDTVHCITIKPNLYMGLVLALRRLQLKKTPRFVQTFPGLGKVFEPSYSVGATARRRFVTMLLRISGSLLDRSATFENTADRNVMVSGGVVSSTRAHVIAGAGIDMKIYRPAPTPRVGKLRFLFASRLLKAKGVGTFLDVAKTIRSEGGKATFLLAGQADLSNPDQFDMSLIDAAHERKEITFLGPLMPDQMVAALQRADVVCLPTRLREGFPRILTEAAACGCALIASDQPAIRQILKQPANGWLIDPSDAKELAETVRECLRDPDAVRRMGIANAASIRQLPVDDEAVSSAFIELYGI